MKAKNKLAVDSWQLAVVGADGAVGEAEVLEIFRAIRKRQRKGTAQPYPYWGLTVHSTWRSLSKTYQSHSSGSRAKAAAGSWRLAVGGWWLTGKVDSRQFTVGSRGKKVSGFALLSTQGIVL